MVQAVGENMKQLELSAEKAVEREEKLKDKILNIQQKYKAAEGRSVPPAKIISPCFQKFFRSQPCLLTVYFWGILPVPA